MKNVLLANQSVDGASAPSIMRSESDFVILCPSAADSPLVQAALYFLPKNYKLRVLTETFQDIRPFSDDQTIMSRISFGSKDELGGTDAPRGSVNAVVYSDEATAVSESTAPRVVISKAGTAAAEATKTAIRKFTVPSDSPEAIASALLRIARTSFA